MAATNKSNKQQKKMESRLSSSSLSSHSSYQAVEVTTQPRAEQQQQSQQTQTEAALPLSHNDNDNHDDIDDNQNDIDDSHPQQSPQSSQQSQSSHLTATQAVIHLVKGNLGPGCLNLPQAFAQTGVRLSVGLLALVACQGIYSMWLLLSCQGALRRSRQSRQSERSSLQLTKKWTFMDVAQAALGPAGGRIVELFLVVLQGGVCCVFFSLIVTNVVAMWTSSTTTTNTGDNDNDSHKHEEVTLLVTFLVWLVLLVIVLLRFISDLVWLSATSNAFMVTAIATATVAGWINYLSSTNTSNKDNDNPQDASVNAFYYDNVYSDNHSTTTVEWGQMVTFLSYMFFAFEGIGLVLPIENSYHSPSPPLQHSQSQQSQSQQSTIPSFATLLLGSMSLVAALFCLVGVSAGLGFPDITSGSITAYLQERDPSNLWYQMVNALVTLAVLLTFPLQLHPAMEVVDRWLDQASCPVEQSSGGVCSSLCWHCCPRSIFSTNEAEVVPTVDPESTLDTRIVETRDDPVDNNNNNGPPSSSLSATSPPLDELEQDGLICVEENASSTSQDSISRRIATTKCMGIPIWVWRRWAFVCLVALIVYTVNNLSTLIALFGAIGQTGLAGMPCAIHLALQRQGVVPKRWFPTVLDYLILSFCAMVMVASVVAIGR